MTTFFWTKYPFVRVASPFLLGIVFAYNTIKLPELQLQPDTIQILHSFCILLFVSIASLYLCHIKIHSFVFLIILCAIGFLHFLLADPRYDVIHINQLHAKSIEELQGHIISEPKIKNGKINFLLASEYTRRQNTWIKRKGLINVYCHDKQKYALGQTLKIKGQLKPIQRADSFYDFDYAQHMAYQKVYHTYYTNHITIVSETKRNPLTTIQAQAIKARCTIESVIKKTFSNPKHQGILIGLITGTRSNLSQEDKELFTHSGTIHILAISGMHIVLIYQVLLFFLSKLRVKERNTCANISVLFLIWFYIYITGLQASTVRAGIMISILLLGKITHKNPQHVNSLFATAFLMLLYNPYYIADIGFCLSFLAIVGILVVSELEFKQQGLTLHIFKAASVSTGAQVATLPYSIFLFQQFPVYFLVANLLLVPLSTLLLLSTIVLLCIQSIPYLSFFLALSIDTLCEVLFYILNVLHTLPMHLIQHISITHAEVTILYLILIATTLTIYSKKKQGLWIMSTLVTVLVISMHSRIINAYKSNSMLVCGYKEKKEYTIIHHAHAYLFKKDTSTQNHYATEKFLGNHLVNTITKIPLPEQSNIELIQDNERLLICRQEDLNAIKKSTSCIIDYKNKSSYITTLEEQGIPKGKTIFYAERNKTTYIKKIYL